MSFNTIPVSLFGEVLENGKEFNLDTFTLARLTSVALDEKASGKSLVKVKFIQQEPNPYGDDSDEEDEDEESSEDEGQEKEIIIACLEAGKNSFQSLDMVLPIGQTYSFTVTGSNKVHLLGQYLDTPEDMDDDYEDEDYDMSDEDDEDMMSDEEVPVGRIRELKSDEEEDEEEEEVPEKKVKEQQPKKSALKNSTAETPKANKAEPKSDAGTPELSKSQKKKLAKKQRQQETAGEDKPKTNGNAADKKRPNEAGETKNAKKPSNRTVHPSGLVVEEKGAGNGPTAQPGRKVSMRYIGRLQNGKVFDSNLKGKPLSFTLGKGQVIQGWDEGIKGLALGGERRLTIPPQLAYGKKGVPGIPGNSTLIFDVKLLGVK